MKQKIIILILLLLSLTGVLVIWTTQNNQTLVQTESANVHKQVTKPSSSTNQQTNQSSSTASSKNDFLCKSNSKFMVVYNDDIWGKFLIKRVGADIPKPICDNTKRANDYWITTSSGMPGSAELPETFLALNNNFLITDSGTGPSGRILAVYNLKIPTNKPVFTDYYSIPVDSDQDNVITYWTGSEKMATAQNCPEYEPHTQNDLGGEINEEVSLNLTTLVKQSLGPIRCNPVQ